MNALTNSLTNFLRTRFKAQNELSPMGDSLLSALSTTVLSFH